MQFSLKQDQHLYLSALESIKQKRILERIWARDFTVWADSPAEISNRLGWLDIADRYASELPKLKSFAAGLHAEGFTQALLLGMGGSSLAPEVLRKTLGVGRASLDLAILDSTDPGAVLAFSRRLDLEKTLFIVSTKSGGTVETFSFFKYFYNLVSDRLGADQAGKHFIAITDPGSGLVDTAGKYNFREIFLNDPNIGGRYSALSMFGLVPAALLGVDVERLLSFAIQAGEAGRDPEGVAARLGAAMGALAATGRDKLTLLASPELESFGDWVEQLVAESTGKDGRGILPVVGEPGGDAEVYGNDRLFVGMTLGEDEALWDELEALNDAGHPTIWINLDDVYRIGAQFLVWELATAVAGHVLGIQPFDQPNVESAKVLARKMVAAYHETGRLPDSEAAEPSAANLRAFLEGMETGEYVAIHAYVTPSPQADAALKRAQLAVRSLTGRAVTVGYGPRFLHSTGQLHKGDRGGGRFIQFISDADEDLPIPDVAGEGASQMSFQVLKRSQALGDALALREAMPPRAVIQFEVGADAAKVINQLAKDLVS